MSVLKVILCGPVVVNPGPCLYRLPGAVIKRAQRLIQTLRVGGTNDLSGEKSTAKIEIR